MIRKCSLFLVFCLYLFNGNANIVKGFVADSLSEKPLPFASLFIKGTSISTISQQDGSFEFNLSPGNYIIVCKYVNYITKETAITVTNNTTLININLTSITFNLDEVVVDNAGNPGLEIIKKAMLKRTEYLNENKIFELNNYTKTRFGILKLPKNNMGKNISQSLNIEDTNELKILYLSENIVNYKVSGLNKKTNVLFARTSGNSNAFGFVNTLFFNCYQETIPAGPLNPRGYVSPIASYAPSYYKYKLLGSYIENGENINIIKVTPRRSFEPTFSGTIHIVENSWRIYATDLYVTKNQQIQFCDSLHLQQLYLPVGNNWFVTQQNLFFFGKIFGVAFYGSVLNVNEKINPNPHFPKNTFDDVLLQADSSALLQNTSAWDSLRPAPLAMEEREDFIIKDSIKYIKEKRLDSIEKRNNKINFRFPLQVALTGKNFYRTSKKYEFRMDGFLKGLNINPVEGFNTQFNYTWTKEIHQGDYFSISFNNRYGFNNGRYNPSLNFRYFYRKKYLTDFSLNGGLQIRQFNNNNPVNERINDLYYLFDHSNFLKIYQSQFLYLSYKSEFGHGFSFGTNLLYENRIPLVNLSQFPVISTAQSILANYPVELTAQPFATHAAVKWVSFISWKIKTKYLSVNNKRYMLRSKYPELKLRFVQGIPKIFNSEVEYNTWDFNVNYNIKLGLVGNLKLDYNIGGFLNKNSVFTPDYTHYNTNQLILSDYNANNFQALPYYSFSNTEKFYFTCFNEYKLNGFLTDKIPLLKKWNWFFIVNYNVLYINPNKYYHEYRFGFDNIFKFLSIVYIRGIDQNKTNYEGLRIIFPLPYFLK